MHTIHVFKKSMKLTNHSDRSFFVECKQHAARYRENKFSPGAADNLRNDRMRLAQYWMCTSPADLGQQYTGAPGECHKSLRESGILHEPLIPVELEFMGKITEYLKHGLDQPQTLNYLLAAMLYCRADQLPLERWYFRIPDWFVLDYLRYIFHWLEVFHNQSEMQSYQQHLSNALRQFHADIFHSDISHEERKRLLVPFSQILRLLPLYFSDQSTSPARAAYGKV